MGYISIITIAVALGLDTFSVGIAAGTEGARRDYKAMARLALSFGFFQFAMNWGGYHLGANIGELFSHYDHWVASSLLFLVGGKMLWDAFSNKTERPGGEMTKGLTLLTLAIATSIDALAVGISFGLVGVPIILASIIIGVVAACMTVIGVIMGNILGKLVGKRATAFGGIVLLTIGFKILGGHLS